MCSHQADVTADHYLCTHFSVPVVPAARCAAADSESEVGCRSHYVAGGYSAKEPTSLCLSATAEPQYTGKREEAELLAAGVTHHLWTEGKVEN